VCVCEVERERSAACLWWVRYYRHV